MTVLKIQKGKTYVEFDEENLESMEYIRDLLAFMVEKIKKKEVNKTMVKIECPTCDGEGWIREVEYKTEKDVQIICMACSGLGYYEAELFEEKEALR
ncbi:MAG: hypothetical protein KKG64_00300 [Firmicutes bacterium]|nr:hypothetical protein [Bacillota bacterium]